MPEEMKVNAESVGKSVVISPQGDIDLARSPALRTALKQAQTAKPERLVVDLGGVDYMDSSGARRWSRPSRSPGAATPRWSSAA
jgi:anti-anti-sigma factor